MAELTDATMAAPKAALKVYCWAVKRVAMRVASWEVPLAVLLAIRLVALKVSQ